MRHNSARMDAREQISALADLMQEYRLSEARIESDGIAVAFRRNPKPVAVPAAPVAVADVAELASHTYEEPAEEEGTVEADHGMAVSSPMAGIFYASPSPSAPPFVREGDEVSEGQVVGLIEAMKVFSEVPATHAGIVTRFAAESGQLVQPGDPLLWIK